MKNFTKVRKGMPGKIAFAILMLVSSLGWAQPTVTVPSTVQVLIAGSGGTLGFGGTVGSGGAVIMPDPGSGSFTLNANGATLTSWSLSGDLSFVPRTSASTTISQSAPISPVTRTIYSFNKVVRTSEAFELARSKGRVSVGYSASACGGSISFDVYKRYSSGSLVPTNAAYVPPIVGPACWIPGEVYTYSVDQIASDNLQDGIGIDNYYWTITNGSQTVTNGYTSADQSSITFTAPAVVTGDWVITVAFGRANPWDGNASGTHTTFVQKPIGSLPTEPNFITAPPTCLATTSGAGTFDIEISGANTDYTYTWEAPGTSWTLVQSGTANANLEVSGMDNNPGTLEVTIVADCEPVTFTYEINRNFTSGIAISGSTCVTAGTTNAFALPTGAQLNDTQWTLPSGWNIVSSNNTATTISVQVPSGTSAGAYTLVARSEACPSTSVTITVNVRPAAPTFITSGTTSPACVVRNGGPARTFAVNPVPGATGYNWTFPAGWSQTSITNGASSVTVTPGGTATSGVITVTALGTGTCNSATVSRVVNYSAIAPNTLTASCWNIGVAGTTTLTVGNAPSPFFGSYTITSSPSGLFTSYSVSSTGLITLNTPATLSPGTYNVTVTHTSPSCGAVSAIIPVTVAGNGASVNTTSFTPGAGNCYTYVINRPAGSTLIWFINGVQAVPNGSTVIVVGNQLILCGNTAPTSICVNVALNGCTTRVCFPETGTHGARLANPDSDSGDLIDMGGIKIYPNPNTGNFVINLEKVTNTAKARINDSAGKNVGTFHLVEGENKINLEGRAKCIYTVILEIDGEQKVHKIILK